MAGPTSATVTIRGHKNLGSALADFGELDESVRLQHPRACV